MLHEIKCVTHELADERVMCFIDTKCLRECSFEKCWGGGRKTGGGGIQITYWIWGGGGHVNSACMAKVLNFR